MRKKNLKEIPIDGIGRLWKPAGRDDFRREYYLDSLPETDPYLPLRVNFVHEEYCYEHYYRRREASEVFSIEMVLEGSMLFTQDEHQYRVGPGSVFLVHLDRDNEFYTGPEKQCHRLACSLTGNALNQLLDATGLIAADVIELNDPARVEKLLRQILRVVKEQNSDFRRHASVMAYEMLLELAGSLPQSRRYSPLVKRAVTLMEHHFSQPLSLARLATLAGSSPTSLHREFQRCLGCSPINYFIQLKMNAAQSLLQNTTLQIQEIAARLGYRDPLYFSTEFSKRFGCSPRLFRQRQK